MQVSELTPGRLRRLAEFRPDQGKVLSLFLDLDPPAFATATARSTMVTSLLDEAERRIEQADLDHDDRAGLRLDAGRVRELLGGGGSLTGGTQALAIYACSPADYLEVVGLRRPLAPAVVIDDSPFVEPLADAGVTSDVCVALVSRRFTRILRGPPERLVEIASWDDEVHGQHDQGGWSQARYQRGIEEQAAGHLRRTAEELFRVFRRAPFERMLIGAPAELEPYLEEQLHPYLRERLIGHLGVDIENSSLEEVRAAASRTVDEQERRRERAALDRLVQGVGSGGRGAGGLEAVLAALHERRVSVLLYEEGLVSSGALCPRCGWVAASGDRCPLDGAELAPRENVIEAAVEAALAQSAEVLPVRHHHDLGPLGGVGAILRF